MGVQFPLPLPAEKTFYTTEAYGIVRECHVEAKE